MAAAVADQEPGPTSALSARAIRILILCAAGRCASGWLGRLEKADNSASSYAGVFGAKLGPSEY